jgi:hypothetical protein
MRNTLPARVNPTGFYAPGASRLLFIFNQDLAGIQDINPASSSGTAVGTPRSEAKNSQDLDNGMPCSPDDNGDAGAALQFQPSGVKRKQ